MAITIDNAFVEQYKGIVEHLAQQKEAKLRDWVTEVSSHGEAYNFDYLAETSMVAKSGRRVDTVYVDDTWNRRVAIPSTFTHTMSIEHEDKVQMLVDPENAYAENQAMAYNRKIDDLIIAAATGTALDGDGSAVTFPAAQKLGDGTAAISFDLVTQVLELFMENDVDMDESKVFVIGPQQVRQLLQLTQVTSADYVHREALQRLSASGLVPNWMGFTWIMSNRLTHSTGTKTSCLAFTKKALGLAVNENIITRIGENPAKSYMIQVFAQTTLGATRVQDDHLVHLEVLES